MVDRIAVKVLSASDLTFFQEHLGRSNRSKQKSINLNANVLTGVLYPALAGEDADVAQEIPVRVSVFGPSATDPEYRFARSITKGARYKNWRLNGAAVPDPDNEPGRFSALQPGDISVIEFIGNPVPTDVRLVLVSQAAEPGLVAALAQMTPGGRRSMEAVSRGDLAELSAQQALPDQHQLRALLQDQEIAALLEEAHAGAEPAVRRLRERVARPVSQADLRAARASAERIGLLGEALVAEFLNLEAELGRLTNVQWVSEIDAAASWDFEALDLEGETVRFDAKSTSGAHGRAFIVSGAEVAAAAGPTPYRIIRASEVSQDGGRIAISAPINGLMGEVLAASDQLPAGLLPVGFSVSPDALVWEDRAYFERPDEPE